MLLTIGEIIQRFRTHGKCVKFSPETITHMAKVLRFTKKRIGGKIGYDQSLITAITQRLDDAMAYENSLKQKTSQKPLKQPQMGDYYTYNGERDNIDYDWEKNENKNMNNKLIRLTEGDLHRIVKESVDRILKESDAEQVIANKSMMYYKILDESDFMWDVFRFDVAIQSNGEVIVGFFDEEKHGIPYSEYEDPDGWELDSYVLPLAEAWELFLGEVYENYIKNDFTDLDDREVWEIINDFRYNAPKYMHMPKYHIRVEEGSPFGYEGE